MTADAHTDRLLGFALPHRDARGRIARLGPTASAILAAHDYPEPLARLLAEALVLASLFGGLLRPDEGQLTLQCMAAGPIKLLVADYRAGEVRGYLQHDGTAIEPGADLQTMFGRGYLAITLDQTTSQERYQGIVPLEGESLSGAAQAYFTTSEQLATCIRVAADPAPGGGWNAGGLLVQHLPRGEQDGPRLGVSGDVEYLPMAGQNNWDHVRALASTLTDAELTDAELPLEDVLWRLFNEDETRVVPPIRLARGCRCSLAHIESVLRNFPADELAAMREPDGTIRVDCEFCAKTFSLVI